MAEQKDIEKEVSLHIEALISRLNAIGKVENKEDRHKLLEDYATDMLNSWVKRCILTRDEIKLMKVVGFQNQNQTFKRELPKLILALDQFASHLDVFYEPEE